jgi:propanol-preferring alcohol dehydrogenase
VPLEPAEVEVRPPGPGEVLIDVSACGVCRTDLHLVDGELPQARFPVIPGHEIVGRVAAKGEAVRDLAIGERVGVPWLAWTCGRCRFCTSGRENLCELARFHGCSVDGGFTERMAADARYAFPLPASVGDVEVAPLLCGGLIGYRAYAKTRPAKRLGLYGFGAAAHILCQLAVHERVDVYAFTRPNDTAAQALAKSLGAVWAGDSSQAPPQLLEAAIIFAPVGELIPAALSQVEPGGIVVLGGIYMSDTPPIPYSLLWGERRIESVANLTRADGTELLALAAAARVRTEVHTYPLADANRALDDLRHGRFAGAAVLTVR